MKCAFEVKSVAKFPSFLGEWRQSTRLCLDTSPLFSHVVISLVQALLTPYDETFQSLVVEGDVLLPKPLLDVGVDGVKSLTSNVVFSVC